MNYLDLRDALTAVTDARDHLAGDLGDDAPRFPNAFPHLDGLTAAITQIREHLHEYHGARTDRGPTELPAPITATEAAALPDGSVVARCFSDPAPATNLTFVEDAGSSRSAIRQAGGYWTVLYRARSIPLGVGARITTLDDLNQVPEGALLAIADDTCTPAAARWVRSVHGLLALRVTGYPGEFRGEAAERFLPATVVHIPDPKED